MRDRLRRLWGGLSAVAFWSLLAAGVCWATGLGLGESVAIVGFWFAIGAK